MYRADPEDTERDWEDEDNLTNDVPPSFGGLIIDCVGWVVFKMIDLITWPYRKSRDKIINRRARKFYGF